MRIVTWTIRLTLFLLLLVFAVWNTEPVTLRYWFGQAWQAPLVIVLLAFFAAGALFGIAAVLGTMLRQRREVGRLRREARVQAQSRPQARAEAPPPALER
jgi:putative membrane protein